MHFGESVKGRVLVAKYTIELGKEFEQQLNQVAQEKSLSKAEIIRRAVATYVVISREAGQGNKVTITDKQDRILKELVTV
jgi:predicted DNA-binding protein